MIPGWNVARMVPHETLMGLVTGDYQLCGGVIRWAAGTANAGQIVRHLIPVGLSPIGMVPGLNLIPEIAANIQLHQIAGNLDNLAELNQKIFQAATGTAMLSGLGLAVCTVGFVAIDKRLQAVDKKLQKIQKDVQDIKHFLETSERAKLYAAINALLKVDARTAPEHCHTILHSARNTLSEINMRYRELFAAADTIETAMAYETYFLLTAIAQAR